MKVFDGVRIVNFSWGATGINLMRGFALFGAEVLKIETSRRLDFVRYLGQKGSLGKNADINNAPIFQDGHLNEYSICINITKPKGVALAKELIKTSDIVVENMLPGTIDRLGLGYEEIKKIKPDIIMLSCSHWGQKVTDSNFPGYAPLFAATSGLSWMSGYEDGPPTELRSNPDYISGLYGFIAMAAALIEKRRTGKGQYIDLSLREVQQTLIGEAFMEYFMTGRVPRRHGNLDDFMAPHNCYPCKGDYTDMWISIAVATNEEWKALCKAMGKAELAQDPRFIDCFTRWQNREELDSIISEWTVNFTSYELMDLLQKEGVAAVPSTTADQIYSDPNFWERDDFVMVPTRDGGSRLTIGWPWKLSSTPFEVERDGPALGEHTRYILEKHLGLSKEEIERLRQEEIVELYPQIER
jgi:benzylsuccinate CoA-transferase BbsF subunit